MKGKILTLETDGHENRPAGGALVHRLVNETPASTTRSQFEWLHFCMKHEAVEQYLCHELGIPMFVANAMVAEETRSRTIVRDNGIMVLFKAMHQHDGANPEMMVSLRLWIEPHRIISAREQDIDAVYTLRDEIMAGHGPASTTDFLIDMIDHVYDEFDPLIDAMEIEIDELEELVQREETEAICGRLSALERRAVIFARHLSPQTAIFEIIGASRCPLVSEDDKDHLNELDSRLKGMLEALRDLRDRSAIIDERIQRIEEFRQSKANLVFAIPATLFLPASFLTGLFGANVGGVLWLEHPQGFLLLSIVCLGVMLSSWLLIRRGRWL